MIQRLMTIDSHEEPCQGFKPWQGWWWFILVKIIRLCIVSYLTFFLFIP